MATERELVEGEMRPLGRLLSSSNGAVLVEVGDSATLAIHKPIAFEKPLWDYPDGHLAHRERAAYLLSEVGGFGIVPTTVLRDGPWGQGCLQEWIGSPEESGERPVVVVAPAQCPAGWLRVVSGVDEDGDEVVLAHEDTPELRSVAVLDAILNNSDRKGGHLARHDGRVHGFDHGVSLGVDPKLRTVLWGWAGTAVPGEDLMRLEAISVALGQPDGPLAELAGLLTTREVTAVRQRVEALLREGRLPLPSGGWPAIPWPAL